MTNSERLVVRSEGFLEAPGQARPDWWAPAAVGRAMGFHGFEFDSAESVWDEFRRLTVDRPCDVSGMTNSRLAAGSLRWPCPHEAHPGTPRRYTNGAFHQSDGRARFHVGRADPPGEQPDVEYPLWLTTGRVATHWHTRTKTGLAPELSRQDPEPFLEMHPRDAQELGLDDGGWCRVVGRRGAASARLRVTDSIREGVVFATFHFGDRYRQDSNINAVTSPEVDPISKQPELKACAVRVEADAEARVGEEGRR